LGSGVEELAEALTCLSPSRREVEGWVEKAVDAGVDRGLLAAACVPVLESIVDEGLSAVTFMFASSRYSPTFPKDAFGVLVMECVGRPGSLSDSTLSNLLGLLDVAEEAGLWGNPSFDEAARHLIGRALLRSGATQLAAEAALEVVPGSHRISITAADSLGARLVQTGLQVSAFDEVRRSRHDRPDRES